ncbi:MAG: hypothetical protein PGN13_06360 [Patulibacter minatonensis]
MSIETSTFLSSSVGVSGGLPESRPTALRAVRSWSMFATVSAMSVLLLAASLERPSTCWSRFWVPSLMSACAEYSRPLVAMYAMTASRIARSAGSHSSFLTTATVSGAALIVNGDGAAAGAGTSLMKAVSCHTAQSPRADRRAGLHDLVRNAVLQVVRRRTGSWPTGGCGGAPPSTRRGPR